MKGEADSNNSETLTWSQRILFDNKDRSTTETPKPVSTIQKDNREAALLVEEIQAKIFSLVGQIVVANSSLVPTNNIQTVKCYRTDKRRTVTTQENIENTHADTQNKQESSFYRRELHFLRRWKTERNKCEEELVMLMYEMIKVCADLADLKEGKLKLPNVQKCSKRNNCRCPACTLEKDLKEKKGHIAAKIATIREKIETNDNRVASLLDKDDNEEDDNDIEQQQQQHIKNEGEEKHETEDSNFSSY